METYITYFFVAEFAAIMIGFVVMISAGYAPEEKKETVNDIGMAITLWPILIIIWPYLLISKR